MNEHINVAPHFSPLFSSASLSFSFGSHTFEFGQPVYGAPTSRLKQLGFLKAKPCLGIESAKKWRNITRLKRRSKLQIFQLSVLREWTDFLLASEVWNLQTWNSSTRVKPRLATKALSPRAVGLSAFWFTTAMALVEYRWLPICCWHQLFRGCGHLLEQS